MWSKVLEFLKKVIAVLSGIAVAAGAVVLAVLGIRKFAGIGRVRSPRSWRYIPGDDGAIMVYHGGAWNRVELPVVDGEKIKSSDVAEVGMSEGGNYYVEILHKPVDRRSRSVLGRSGKG